MDGRKEVGSHEVEYDNKNVWECVHCGAKADRSHFRALSMINCTPQREIDASEE